MEFLSGGGKPRGQLLKTNYNREEVEQLINGAIKVLLFAPFLYLTVSSRCCQERIEGENVWMSCAI